MRALGRLIVGLAAAGGALTASQLPEFTQQYRQRLGGAVDELLRVVADFDADAARNPLTGEARFRRTDDQPSHSWATAAPASMR